MDYTVCVYVCRMHFETSMETTYVVNFRNFNGNSQVTPNRKSNVMYMVPK